METPTLAERLREIEARPGLISSVEAASDEAGIEQIWARCERADRLIWLASRMAGREGWPVRGEVILAAGDCVETALRYIPADERRPDEALALARQWVAAEDEAERERLATEAFYAAHRATYGAAYSRWGADQVAKLAAWATAEIARAAAYAKLAVTTAWWASDAAARAVSRAAQAHDRAGEQVDLVALVHRRLSPGPPDQIHRRFTPQLSYYPVKR